MPAKIYDIESTMEHMVSEVICINCKSRFICSRPSEILQKNLECHGCGEMGFIIETGQDIDAIDGYYGEIIEYIRKPQ